MLFLRHFGKILYNHLGSAIQYKTDLKILRYLLAPQKIYQFLRSPQQALPNREFFSCANRDKLEILSDIFLPPAEHENKLG